MKNKTLRMLILWLPVALVMIFIFVLSAQSADDSQDLSDYFIIQIFDIIKIAVPSIVIRKAAHMFEFMVLCFFTSNALYKCGDGKWAFSAVIITLFYACTDEIHQMLVPGRAGRASDVIIDMSGAVIGLCIYLLIHRYRSKKNGKNQTV